MSVQGAMLLGKAFRDSHPVETTVREAILHVKRYARTGIAPPPFAGHTSIPAPPPSLSAFKYGRARALE